MFGRHNKLDTDWLGTVPFFRDFNAAELEEVANLGNKIEAEIGAELTDQGRFGDVCYVIVEGTANVLMNGEYVATVGPGSMVGEMALLEHRPRNASVVAEQEMVLVAFTTKDFRAMLDRSPSANEKVLTLLNARVAANRDRSAE